MKRRGRKSAAQTPAPPKERIYGSKKNPKGSAASKSAASKIELSTKALEALKAKRAKFKKENPSKDVSVSTLKAVMRRGMGAYSTSFRPTITGGKPNSRQAWGYARVNKFLKKKAGEKVKAAYVQDDDLLKDGGELYHLGGDMSKHLAPNGKPSNLTHEQWHLVRTPQFKAWFGDWENDPANASKVVDENGEPLVLYRGTSGETQNVSGFWLTKSKSYAEGFGEVKEYFAKVLNPMPEDEFNRTWMVDFDKYDGRLGDFHKLVVKQINQIKLADGTNTTFDPNNPDIRYAEGGLIASNGKKSNLTPEQYNLVRTPQFKTWFGDWENDPKNASKVVDENGEPLVVYHGSDYEFTIFKNDRQIYFATNREYAIQLTDTWKDSNAKAYFLNIRKILDATKFELNDYTYKEYEIFLKSKGINFEFDKKQLRFKRKFWYPLADIPNLGKAISEKYDGLSFYENEYASKGKLDEGELITKVYCCFEPNQIKLADGTNTTFDPNNADIRYADGGFLHSIQQGMDNLIKNGIVLTDKAKDITLIAYNTGNQEIDKSLYNKSLIYYSIKPLRQATEIIERLDNGEYSHFDVKKVEEYKNAPHLIVVNQNEIVYDSNNPDKRYADGGATDFGKIVSASSRFKPMETVVFNPPLVGLNGAKLTSYTWSYTYDLGYDKREGETYEKRVSDWTQADISADTGRGIVHKYTIEMPNGEVKSVSSDSVPILLGYTDRKQSKTFPNLATASKTLAKQKLQLAILEAKSKEREDAKKAIIAEGFPPIVVEEGTTFGLKLSMDGASCYADNPNDEERIECVKDAYIRKRLIDMGIDYYAYYNIYDLKNRIARQERKIQEILKSQDKFEDGGEISQFTSYQDALAYVDMRAKDFKNKNEFLLSEEYKQIYPHIVELYKTEKADYAKVAKKAMDEVGVNFGDRVYYDFVSPFNVENYSGVIANRDGLPYVKLDEGQKTISGQKSVKWHKGWKKENNISKNLLSLENFIKSYVYKDPTKESRWRVKGSNYTYSSKKEASLVAERIYQRELHDAKIKKSNSEDNNMNYVHGGDIKEEIALPDTFSTYDKLKPILENQGYELNKIKMEDNTILISDTPKHSQYFDEVKAAMGISVLKPEVPVAQIAKEQGVSQSKVKEELKQGIEVEKEHTNVEKAARAVASQHLQERIDYYDKLGKLEKSPIKKDSGGYIVSEQGGREIAHNNADMGGILVGRRHSQGGIKGKNKGTNQPIEVEGGEIVISSKAVGASDNHRFNGKEMTNREILSFLNTEGGGVAFKVGGETDKPIQYEGGEVILTRGVLKNPKKYEFNGKMMSSKEIASAINKEHTGVSFDEGGDVAEVEVEMSYDKVTDSQTLVDYLFDAYDLKTLPTYLRTLILHSKLIGMEIPHETKRGGATHNNMVYGTYDYIEMHDGRIVDYFISDFVASSHGFSHFGEYKQLPLLSEDEVKDLLEAHLMKDIKLIEHYCIKYGR